MSKMNSTSLYVTTNQIILKSQPENPSTWQDLYRLLPYLRNSLCCVVCGQLLISPLTPQAGKCQHHLCKKCTGGKKKIKPACVWCKDCDTYNENKQLRTLLQCYKKMCVYLFNSGIYKCLMDVSQTASTGVERGAGNLIALIKEGAMFQDQYESNVGLTKELYSILPCVYTNSATQTLQNCSTQENKNLVINHMNQKNTNGAPVYSVMFAGSGNKITIKRKPKEERSLTTAMPSVNSLVKREEKSIFKKPTNKCSPKPRRGCRCGNATATPGKLTCCGQRCPCYVDSKACIDCKCRGCRNPHTLDGNKVLNLPHHMLQYREHNSQQILLAQQAHQPVTSSTRQGQALPTINQDMMLQHVKIELDANLTIEQLNEHLMFEPFSEVAQSLPHTFLMNTKREEEDEEVTVDV